MRSRVIGSVLVAVALGGLTVGDGDLGARTRLSAFGASAMARAETWFRSGPVYSQDGCYQTAIGYAATDCSGTVLGGCHRPYYRTD